MVFAVVQLLAAAAALLAKAVGSSSPGLTAFVRILLLSAPLAADVDINPLFYYILFISSATWTLLSSAAIVRIAMKGSSLAR